MKRKYRKYILTSVVLITLVSKIFFVSGETGTSPFIIERYNINSGLSSDYLRALWQDREGYLWIATSNGLNRFDGYKTRIYKPEYDKEETFNSLNFSSITEDNQGNLWIGTDHSGINIFNKHAHNVKIFDRSDTLGHAILDNNINHLMCDSRGRIWICSFGGLNLYYPETDKMITFSDPERPGKTNPFGTISYAYEDRSGKILIGTWGNGVYIYNEQEDDFTQILMPDEAYVNDSSNRVVKILEDKDGYYWFGTWEGGLFKVNLQDHKKLNILQYYSMDSPGEIGLSSNIVYCLYEDSEGAIWVGTPYGLNIINRHETARPKVTFIQSGKEPGNISHNDLFHIYQDRSGVIWLATGGGGLNKINPGQRRIDGYTIPEIEEFHETQSIRSFIMDEDSSLLVGVHGLGFGKYLLKERIFIPYKSIDKFKHLPDNINAATCFHRDREGNLWIGTRYSGLFLIHSETGRHTQFLNYDPVTGDRSRMINVLYEDNFGNIWTGTNNGLFKFVPAKDYPGYSIFRFLPDANDPYSMEGEYVSAIFEDSDSILWVGTVGGALNTFKNQANIHSPIAFDHLYAEADHPGSIRSNIVYDIHEDRVNQIWIATGTAGLALYNKDEGTFTHFLKQAGFHEDAVFDIIEEGENLWLSTNNGLIRFRQNSPDDYQVEVFTTDDGLLGNVFIDGAFYRSDDGRIFAGGYYGFNVFNPEDLVRNTYIPPVAITSIWVSDKLVNVYEAMKNGLILKYNQNNLRVEFSSLSFTQPAKNKYAYFLEGLDENWQKTNYEGRLVNYSHIPAGHYTLYLNASNNSDVWNETPLGITIRVKPHPARSWWAIMIYSLLVIGVLITIYYFLINNIKIKQAYEIEKIERKKDENINQFKFRFFTNISHELLTPLSVLSFSVEDLISKRIVTDERLQIMERNVKRIMNLISQLLDFRKVESGSMTPL
ncbi:MAG: hypothetical protein IH594_12890, partial [Bacteroidales bacterium]|nr:hypothetical protein [Bacteroidales bacterium]